MRKIQLINDERTLRFVKKPIGCSEDESYNGECKRDQAICSGNAYDAPCARDLAACFNGADDYCSAMEDLESCSGAGEIDYD